MKQALMKERLHRFIETAEDKRLKAIYALLEPEIEQEEWEYTDEFKAELDNRLADYLHGGAIVASTEADRQLGELLKKIADR